MDVILNQAGLSEALEGERCVLVPTMGALHEGHLSLIDLARAQADELGLPLAASIFVNPDQFNDPADLESYPRPLTRDLDLLLSRGVEVAFVPDVQTMYPSDDPSAAPQPDVPSVGTEPGLEDDARPGHFAGVCRVVSRLFDLLDPAAAVFGEKDWQQTRVIESMCREQARPTRIIVGSTAREPDGLAMSSRNARLTPDERPRAAGVRWAIEACRSHSDPDRAERELTGVLQQHGLVPEYATIRDEQSLVRRPGLEMNGRRFRVLVAARLGDVRLLDNAPWPA